ncbi:hypothetical protein MVEN_02577000 [Mycena venus]|uniref:Uncharacterized protein n=1 Tax=Mycena venus TaxID=2733690 RepID=A0A8H6U1M4_9AGAR|nr:hypothetical protein MVEN_02577000 [Mycena venus]
MQMFAQIIINQRIFLQTLLVDSQPSKDCWKLKPDCKIPEHAITFLVAIMCHSKTQGTRLIGFVEVGKAQALLSWDQKNSLYLNLSKVNPDGPSLTLEANVSACQSFTMPLNKSIDIPGEPSELSHLTARCNCLELLSV